MDRCRTEQPELVVVEESPRHSSACWLPPDLLGTNEQVKEDRRAASAAGRGGVVEEGAA